MAETLCSDDIEAELAAARAVAANEHLLGNPNLPIANHRWEIEAALSDNPVTILVARTGSGKSTQLAQFAVEMRDALGVRQFDKIFITQPRIPAARSVCERVAYEIAEAGQDYKVGYYTSRESTTSELTGRRIPQRDQDIAFLTDGKAVAQLLYEINEPNPDTKRLLIIDEVHEQNINIEQLIAIATEKTDPRSKFYDPNLKVVIMSATVDSQRLKQHFKHVATPVVEVKMPPHEVKRFETKRQIPEVALKVARDNKAKTLVFLAGKGEMDEVEQRVAKMQENASVKIPVIILHGQQTAEEQSVAFEDYQDGAIVLTTNVAQTSITVPDAFAVIDSGEFRIDEATTRAPGGKGLFVRNSPRADLDQKAGRVGRTGPGEYWLCSPGHKLDMIPYDDERRPEYSTPAIERTNLDGMLLRLKATDHDVSDFRFLNEPPAAAIKMAKKRLFNLGAIDQHGTITERGMFMADLPLEPEYACMIAYAYENKYSDEVKRHLIDIASIMQVGGILSRSPESKNWRTLLATTPGGEPKESTSDLAAQLEVYSRLVNPEPPFSPIPQTEWGSYNIIEHAASLVEQERVSLAEKLGVILEPPTAISPEHRQTVMTCIHAGQLNQLWKRESKGWSLVLGKSETYQLSESSVVSKLGGTAITLATGELFSLGRRDKVEHAIQDVNQVSHLSILEQVAAHLVREVVDTSKKSFYDPESQQQVEFVHRMLGGVILSTAIRPANTKPGSRDHEIFVEGENEHAWNNWEQQADPIEPYTLDTVVGAIEQPECVQYGIDRTGRPLLAWKGGKGWCKTEEIARGSLIKCQARLIKQQNEPQLRLQKAAVKAANTELRRIVRKGGAAKEEATQLLADQKKNMDKEAWLAKYGELCESLQPV